MLGHNEPPWGEVHAVFILFIIGSKDVVDDQEGSFDIRIKTINIWCGGVICTCESSVQQNETLLVSVPADMALICVGKARLGDAPGVAPPFGVHMLVVINC